MLALLEELVNTDSGSYNKKGVDAAGSVLRNFLEDRGIPCEIIPIETHGDAIRATVSGANGNQPILFMGHRDTVFPEGEPTRRPFRVENGRAYGPGVADMKAGLAMSAFLLAAFHELGGAPAPLVALFTGDEEIASPTSRPIIEDEARKARAVFNCEPGRPSGNIVTGRKGGAFLRCEVFGKAAHSGGNFKEGISAIEELARKIQAWHKLTDHEVGSTLNVGLVEGGQSVNTVAPYAACAIDTRFVTMQDRDAMVEAVTRIATECSVPGTRAEIEITGEFAPLQPSSDSQALFDHYVAAAADAGLEIGGEFSGGCADSGFAAQVGAPTLCAVGPVGGKGHSPEEYLEVGSLVPRAQALALSILRLDRMG
ncbi:MAG: M20 family metallopeptidase [Hyphomicrobiales bacterium]|nr:M20 family metallopeptidase [Hyphomicrobiales bacterium]